MTNQLFDVFLAHNSQDKPQVKVIASELKQRGLNPWIDEEQIPPGRWFQDVIQQAIPHVKSAAIFIGLRGLGKWQTVELRTFISQCVEVNMPVIPVLLPGVDKIPPNLPFLKELNWVSFTNGINEIEALDNLEWGITGCKPTSTNRLVQSSTVESMCEQLTENIEICFAYSHKDEKRKKELNKHFISLQGEDVRISWCKNTIQEGYDWCSEMPHNLNTAHIIGLLISPDFLNDSWYQQVVEQAMRRHLEEKIRVIPILLRSVDFN